MIEAKLLVFDLDGTLLDASHRVPETIRTLLFRLREAGIEVTLATGRPFTAVQRFVRELDLRLPLIVFNGAAVVKPDGEPLALRPLPLRQAKVALGILGETTVANHIYLRPTDAQFTTDRLGPAADHIREKDGMDHKLAENLSDLLDRLDFDPIKIFSIGSRAELERVQTAFRSAEPEATCVFSEHDMLEFLGPDVTKGSALVTLCDAIDVSIESVMAFGDNLNDLEMLRAAGIGVSMASAPDEVRREADAIAEDLASYLRTHLRQLTGMEEAV